MVQINSIEFDNVSFGYPGREPVLKEASFSFPAGQACVLRGKHGTGRSTILQLLAGLITPDSGVFKINSEEASEMSFEEFLPYRLRIGYAFDLGGLISNRTLYDNLMLPLLYHKQVTVEEASQKVLDYMKRFDIIKYKDERPAHVSGGIRKTSVLIRSIIHNPDLLLLDDPTIGLSKDAQQIFGFALMDLRKAGFIRTIVLSSYDERFNSIFEPKDVFIENEVLKLGEGESIALKAVG